MMPRERKSLEPAGSMILTRRWMVSTRPRALIARGALRSNAGPISVLMGSHIARSGLLRSAVLLLDRPTGRSSQRFAALTTLRSAQPKGHQRRIVIDRVAIRVGNAG